jgi:hypothetical protein
MWNPRADTATPASVWTMMTSDTGLIGSVGVSGGKTTLALSQKTL